MDNPTVQFNQLAAGNSVTLANGKVIKPSDVYFDSIPAAAFITVFLPDETYI